MVHFTQKKMLLFARAATIRYIAGDFRRSDDCTVFTFDRGDGERNLYRMPSLRRRTVS